MWPPTGLFARFLKSLPWLSWLQRWKIALSLRGPMMTALSGLINLMGLISGASSQRLANLNVRKLKCQHVRGGGGRGRSIFALPPLHTHRMHTLTSALVVTFPVYWCATLVTWGPGTRNSACNTDKGKHCSSIGTKTTWNQHSNLAICGFCVRTRVLSLSSKTGS